MMKNLYLQNYSLNEIRIGYRSDKYFKRSKIILENKNDLRKVKIQIFQREKSILCGIKESIEILKECVGFYSDKKKSIKLFKNYLRIKKSDKYKDLRCLQKDLFEVEKELDNIWVNTFNDIEIFSLNDGDIINPWETVMTIEGPLSYFVNLETIYLGILSRRTKIATNVNKVVLAANKKPILFFPARFDHFSLQEGDGYAAIIGGADSISTDAQGEWKNIEGVGTIPHAFISAFNGNTVKAAELFNQNFPDIKLIVVVDYDNDSVKTSIDVAKRLGEKLWAVRIDTSSNMVDQSIISSMGNFIPTGVNQNLVMNVRDGLDKNGFKQVKIIVSGGFDFKKIKLFEKNNVPVDIYGVGSSILKHNIDFTADIVTLNGITSSKKGRKINKNSRLKLNN